jgi:hypothetical protein
VKIQGKPNRKKLREERGNYQIKGNGRLGGKKRKKKKPITHP